MVRASGMVRKIKMAQLTSNIYDRQVFPVLSFIAELTDCPFLDIENRLINLLQGPSIRSG